MSVTKEDLKREQEAHAKTRQALDAMTARVKEGKEIHQRHEAEIARLNGALKQAKPSVAHVETIRAQRGEIAALQAEVKILKRQALAKGG